MTARAADFLPARRIRLVETPAPVLSPEQRAAMDHAWDVTVRANPAFFDGPVAALTGVGWRDGGHDLVLSWARATYRFRALRRVPGAPPLASLFVTVLQPADDGRLLVGRTGRSTASPGRWQLPGGTVEPPDADAESDISWLRRHAARELAEETGSDTAPEALALWRATRGANGSVGVHFLAPPRPAAQLRERYEALVAAETARGVEPELDRIELVGSTGGPAALEGPQADYLRPVVDHYGRTASPRTP
ncbi:NUDIX hydrolase [Streptomyces sp. NPDC006739]|uniref:NUDIX hydrolase n=1 Tax=Streptomyces sp. NPDC006739 TaxID=3364763 RepID=UPI0036A747D1